MRSLRVAAAAAALTLALAACGSSSSASSSTTTQTQAAGGGGGSTSQPAASGKTIAVTEKDFSISIAGGNHIAKAGTYTFVVTNKGPSSHNLTIEGPGVSNQATPTSGPGTQNLTVTLKQGKYDFFCSVPGHKALGMNVDVTVGSSNAGAASTSSGGASTSSGGGWS
jgi:plastocyanin